MCITILVSYDDAHPVPTDDDLVRGVFAAVEIGLLNDAAEQCIVETWDVTVENRQE
jgi:hypothetical protein